MPAFPFQSILLHQLPDAQGWQIIGITSTHRREIIATIAPVTGEWLAERWAGLAAQSLAGMSGFDVD